MSPLLPSRKDVQVEEDYAKKAAEVLSKQRERLATQCEAILQSSSWSPLSHQMTEDEKEVVESVRQFIDRTRGKKGAA